MSVVDLAMPGDGVWQRALMTRIIREVSVKVSMQTGQIFTGFVTGLDEEYLQLCLLDTQKPVWLARIQITSMEEGVSLDKANLAPTQKKAIRDFSTKIRAKSQQILKGEESVPRSRHS